MICIGPYAPAVLRFHVFFPPGYPDLPPLITFITDIFHPLVTPVTSYTYGAITPESGGKSAADEQRLPPGAFGLADAFPLWFGASERSTTSEVQSSAEQVPPRPSMASVLNYLKRSFDDSDVLNRLPAEAATNPGAWKAWQAYRVSIEVTSSALQDKHKSQSLKSQARHPDDWSWEGVWERRVRKGIDASISDQVLFGASGGDEMVELQLFPTACGTDILIADSFCPHIGHKCRRTRSCLGTKKPHGLLGLTDSPLATCEVAEWLNEQWTSSFMRSVFSIISFSPALAALDYLTLRTARDVWNLSDGSWVALSSSQRDESTCIDVSTTRVLHKSGAITSAFSMKHISVACLPFIICSWV